MCESQGKMEKKTKYKVAAVTFASIKEQLKGYVREVGVGKAP